MACPYFILTVRHPRELWPHRHNLPLGNGFSGLCAASTPPSECDDKTLRAHCNLGYAEPGGEGCVHFPAERELDAVRFHVRQESSSILRVQFCGERAHRPALAGELRYDLCSGAWETPPDRRIVKLAEAAVSVWVSGHVRNVAADPEDSIATRGPLAQSKVR